jgi:hypothetical protein
MHVFTRILALSTLVMALGALTFLPASAQIVVSSPVPAAAQSLTSWYSHHIPARFRATSRLTIRELPEAEMDIYLHGGSEDASHSEGDDMADIDGVYESQPDRMALRLPPAHGIDMFTFAHEYGHYVWFHLFSDDDRRRYETLYKHRRTTSRLVTRYAGTSVEEGFAEAFSFYVAEPPILAARDPDSFQFLSRWGLRPRPSL